MLSVVEVVLLVMFVDNEFFLLGPFFISLKPFLILAIIYGTKSSVSKRFINKLKILRENPTYKLSFFELCHCL
jgi:hypothetical protein